MPVNNQEIMNIIRTLAQEEKLGIAVKRCVRSGLIIGGAAAAGGILLGPVGLAIGAAVSGCMTAFSERNKFSSLVEIIDEMSQEEKDALAENVRNIVGNLDVTDAVALAGLLNGNSTLRRQVTNELLNFVNNEIRMAVANH